MKTVPNKGPGLPTCQNRLVKRCPCHERHGTTEEPFQIEGEWRAVANEGDAVSQILEWPLRLL